jgi:hypothetical protein
MHALGPSEMRGEFPKAWDYLVSMRDILDQRKGFTEWEKGFRADAFYAIQRIGDYTFAPYKVAWRYIASDFILAVIGPDSKGRPRLANDKVIFVGLEDSREAYFLCGFLSSDPVRWKVTAYASTTQISVSAIETLKIPKFDPANVVHRQIGDFCEAGHAALQAGDIARASSSLTAINGAVARIFCISNLAMSVFRQDLEGRYPSEWSAFDVNEGEDQTDEPGEQKATPRGPRSAARPAQLQSSKSRNARL